MKNMVQIFAPLGVAATIALFASYFYGKVDAIALGMLSSVVALGYAFLFTFFYVTTNSRFYKAASHQAMAIALGCATGFMFAGSVVENYSVFHLFAGTLGVIGCYSMISLVLQDHDKDTNRLKELLTPLGLMVGVFCLVLGKHFDWSFIRHLFLSFGIPALLICAQTGMNSLWFEAKPVGKQNPKAYP